jgi:hypothetical protein
MVKRLSGISCWPAKAGLKLTTPGSGRFTYLIEIAVLNSTQSRRIILINQNNYKSLRQGVEQRGQSEQHSGPFGIVKRFFQNVVEEQLFTIAKLSSIIKFTRRLQLLCDYGNMVLEVL